MEQLSEIEIASVTEISPGNAALWRPSNFHEWVEQKRVDALLEAWSEQAKQERSLRKTTSKWIFALIAFQMVGIFAIVSSIGLGWMNIGVPILQVLIAGVCAEVFGLGLLITKFLYREPLRIELPDVLHRDKDQHPPSAQKRD
jgi:hypothetical protein